MTITGNTPIPAPTVKPAKTDNEAVPDTNAAAVMEEGSRPEQGERITASSPEKQTPQEQRMLRELQAADTAVRAHEAAHLSAGGGIVTGGANFSYTRGPDGKLYATGGEVPIDAAEANTPETTLQKARRIRAAALAPSDPSPQDYKVAAMAISMELKANLEIAQALQEALQGHKAYAEASIQNNEAAS
jgi:hypothetical protein